MNNQNDLHYFVEDAARVIYKSVSATLRSKLTLDKIEDILDIEMDFYKLKGLISDEKPRDESGEKRVFIDIDELTRYIVDKCVNKEMDLAYDDVSQILKGEDIYMKQIGIID